MLTFSLHQSERDGQTGSYFSQVEWCADILAGDTIQSDRPAGPIGLCEVSEDINPQFPTASTR